MNTAKFSIKKPVMVVSVFILTMFTGMLSYYKLGVDLFPDVSFPVVAVTTTYPGAGPQEIEQLVTKPIEKELSTLSGISSIKSTNKEGISQVIAEFTLDTDVRFAEQQVKDKVSSLKAILPSDIEEPYINNFDPADQPIVVLSLTADLKDSEIYDLADNEVRPLLEQVKNVGQVDIVGGRKKQIHVNIDRKKLESFQLSANQISNQIGQVGRNVPAGKLTKAEQETVIRTVGEFDSLKSIEDTIISFYGNENTVKVSDIATVSEALEDVSTKNYINGNQSLSLVVKKQSGANTIEVASKVKQRIIKLNEDFKSQVDGFNLSIDRDGSRPIQANVDDVLETIIFGVLLVVLVVFFFLGNFRSTIITGIAIPNSLIGAFVFISLFGFTINIMTLLAMSLAVGLLIDDAIVVRENIFRHMEMGKSALNASIDGTKEIFNAVLGTSLTVLAVFAPIAFIDGIVGQFFKEFGLTVCFIIIISTVDALVLAPMMSTYFSGPLEPERKNFLSRLLGRLVDGFDHYHTKLEEYYGRFLKLILRFKKTTLFISFAIAAGSIVTASYVPKTFTPPQDTGEFVIGVDAPPGTSIEKMDRVMLSLDNDLRSLKQVKKSVVTVGGAIGEPNEGQIFVVLVPSNQREGTTSEVKEKIRRNLFKKYKKINPKMLEVGSAGGGQQPFQVSIIGNNMDDIQTVAKKLKKKLESGNDLKDVTSSYKEGKPELQVQIDKTKADEFGVSSTLIGQELRTQIEGATPAVYRKNGYEYDIRVRLQEKDRNLEENFKSVLVPNINNRLINLRSVADLKKLDGPATILRQDRGRYIQISGDLNSDGGGLGAAMAEVNRLFESGEIELPSGTRYEFIGQAENFKELAENMLIAIVLALVLIFLVLASLYESFITPITIMSVIPLAACGAIYGLGLFGKTIDIFSIIGCILLMAVATKNSIILIDYIEQKIAEGLSDGEAIIDACVIRLRPILMTALSLIAGMIPLAIGLNEASSQRTSMGVAVIGGTLTSTLLTLFVIPAVFTYMKRFGAFTNKVAFKVLTKPKENELEQLG